MALHRTLSTLQLGLKSIRVHPLRSSLTVLGIVLGVASVIIMLSIGEAARFQAIQQIKDLGATNLIVRSVKPPEDDNKKSNRQFMLNYGLTIADMERIAATIPTVTSVTPFREFRKEVRYLDHKLDARIVGVSPNFLIMNGLHLSLGRFISDVDEETYANVVVLGAELAEKLFPVDDPIGQQVKIGEHHAYTVIGVTESRAPSAGIGSSLAAQDYNRDAYIPFATDQVRFGKTLLTVKPGSRQFEILEVSQIKIAIEVMSL